jgi:hypothetical protein
MSKSLVEMIGAVLVEPRSARCAVNDWRNGSGDIIVSLLHIDRSCCWSLITDDIVMSEYRDPQFFRKMRSTSVAFHVSSRLYVDVLPIHVCPLGSSRLVHGRACKPQD